MCAIQTKWKREYKPRFHFKHEALQNRMDKRNIKYYAIAIANEDEPSEIGGSVYCPEVDALKLQFNTGWSMIYQVKGNEVHFLDFYREPVD